MIATTNNQLRFRNMLIYKDFRVARIATDVPLVAIPKQCRRNRRHPQKGAASL
jgi:hypothetical protein